MKWSSTRRVHIILVKKSRTSEPVHTVSFCTLSTPVLVGEWILGRRILVVLFLLPGITPLISAQTPDSSHTYYFYSSLPYGSEATFNPFAMVINGGFDEFQTYGREDNLFRTPWRVGATNVWKNITNPLPQIRFYGTKRFIQNEIIPSSIIKDRDQWFPNYTLHLFGGGMEYRKAAEWYDAHGYPVPYVLSAVTTMTYHYINEIVENGPYVGSNVDPIPDLLLFDPLGIVLFSFDGVSKFFSSELSFNDWSYQPAISLGPLAVRNIGQNFVVKYPITKSGGTSLFYHFGNFGMLGLSFKSTTGEAISVGAGVISKGIYILGFDALTESIYTGPIVGVYYDRNNSLLASLVVMDSKKDILRANVYPGMLSIAGFSPGVFLEYGVGNSLSVGFTAQWLPVGLGLHSQR